MAWRVPGPAKLREGQRWGPGQARGGRYAVLSVSVGSGGASAAGRKQPEPAWHVPRSLQSPRLRGMF